MFTDIVTSTDLIGLVGDEAWAELLSWHNRELRSAFASHRGTEVNYAGDGFFVAFDQAADAIECAVDIQRRLTRHRRDHGFAPSVRIGLHTSEATPDGRNYSGRGVHVAARIGAAASGQEILVSGDVLEQAGHTRFKLSEPRALTLKESASRLRFGPSTGARAASHHDRADLAVRLAQERAGAPQRSVVRPPGAAVADREVQVLLLRLMQAQDRFHAVQEALQIRPVIAARALRREVADQAIEQPREPEDLLVRRDASTRSRRPSPSPWRASGRWSGPPAPRAAGGHPTRTGGSPRGRPAPPPAAGRRGHRPSRGSGRWMVRVRGVQHAAARWSRSSRGSWTGTSTPPRRARSALRITTTSMASWRIAPATTGSKPEGGGRHRHDGQPHPEDHALDGDRARPSRDLDRLGQAIEPVHRDDDVGCLGGRARAAGPHRHANVGECEGRCVVEPIADHHDRPGGVRPLGADGIDLLGRHPIGQDRVDADGRSDDVGDRRVVAGDHRRSA